jgi:formylglycine-generating enzyme required for sulfatase activity
MAVALGCALAAPVLAVEVQVLPAAPEKPLEPPKTIPPGSHPQGKPIRDCRGCPEMVGLAGTGFAIGKYEITRQQWAAFAKATGHPDNKNCFVWRGKNWTRGGGWREPGFAQGNKDPVVCVSWNDASAYAEWLSKRTGKEYRLPTEAEWVAACQAGAAHEYCGSDDLDAVAWYGDNAKGRTHPVGQKKPNAWGLHDMSGNVWEWTADCTRQDENPCTDRQLRGGAWRIGGDSAKAAYREHSGAGAANFNLGFRLVRIGKP